MVANSGRTRGKAGIKEQTAQEATCNQLHAPLTVRYWIPTARSKWFSGSSLRHLKRHDVHLVFVGINMRRQDNVVSLVSLDCIRIDDRPALVVFVAHKRLAVVA